MVCARSLLTVLVFFCLLACAPVSQQQQKSSAQQADVHYKLGISHLRGNNPTLALKELLIAVENGPNNHVIHAALAQAYQMKRAYQLAEKHYLRALELSDNEPSYQNNLASLYLDMEQWDKAIEYFDQASANLLFLNSHSALTGKGYAYFRKQEYQQALQVYREVITLAPRYPRVYYLQSETYLAMGEEDLARRTLEKTIEVAPGYVPAHYQLGVLAMKQQDTTTAREYFEKVVELAPGADLGLRATRLLRALEQPADSQDAEQE